MNREAELEKLVVSQALQIQSLQEKNISFKKCLTQWVERWDDRGERDKDMLLNQIFGEMGTIAKVL